MFRTLITILIVGFVVLVHANQAQAAPPNTLIYYYKQNQQVSQAPSSTVLSQVKNLNSGYVYENTPTIKSVVEDVSSDGLWQLVRHQVGTDTYAYRAYYINAATWYDYGLTSNYSSSLSCTSARYVFSAKFERTSGTSYPPSLIATERKSDCINGTVSLTSYADRIMRVTYTGSTLTQKFLYNTHQSPLTVESVATNGNILVFDGGDRFSVYNSVTCRDCSQRLISFGVGGYTRGDVSVSGNGLKVVRYNPNSKSVYISNIDNTGGYYLVNNEGGAYTVGQLYLNHEGDKAAFMSGNTLITSATTSMNAFNANGITVDTGYTSFSAPQWDVTGQHLLYVKNNQANTEVKKAKFDGTSMSVIQTLTNTHEVRARW